MELSGEGIYLIWRMKLNLCQNLQYLKNVFDQKCDKKVHDKLDNYFLGQDL